MIYLLTVCGRSVGVLWFAVGALSVLSPCRWGAPGSLSPLSSFLELGRNCSAVVIPSPAYPCRRGAVVPCGSVCARSAVFCLVGAELLDYANKTP